MRKFLGIGASIVLVAASSARASQNEVSKSEKDYLTFGEAHVVELEDKDFDASAYLAAIANKDEGSDAILNPINLADVIIDKIINMGKKVWQVVEAGRPVVNLKFDSANAVPEGTKNWQQLAGWQVPVSHKYQVTYTNAYGGEVVNFQYREIFTPGGNVQGKGLYMAGIATLPDSINVSWGYQFGVQAGVPNVLNMGTSDAPVAGAQSEVKWTISTVMKYEEKTLPYLMKGDGSFKAL